MTALPTPEDVARAPTRRSTHYLPVRIRLEQIRSLTARGWTTARIARHLNISPRTVRRDIQRLRRIQHLEFARLADANGRLQQIEVHHHVQAAAWQAADAILAAGDFHHRNLAPLLRTILVTQRAIASAMDAQHPRSAITSVRDLVAQFTQEEIDADLTGPGPVPNLGALLTQEEIDADLAGLAGLAGLADPTNPVDLTGPAADTHASNAYPAA